MQRPAVAVLKRCMQRHRGRHPGEEAPPDRGCSVWPSCVTCPWSTHIAELPAREHTTFVHALRLVRSYPAKPDGAIVLD